MTTVGTLCYIIKHGKVLLIQKKRGLGAGKWNGPGGKINSGESIEDAASREVFEEIDVAPDGLRKMGEIEFYMGQEAENGRISDASVSPDWVVHVFVADDYDGIEKETKEAVPKWFSLNRIPYDDMWPDDRIWLPLVLERKRIKGRFYLDKGGKNVVRHDIEVLS